MVKTGFIWSPQYTKYNLGDTHPMNLRRLIIPYRLFESIGILKHPDILTIDPQPASDSDLLLYHSSEYVKAVKVLSEIGSGTRMKYGLGTSDCPVFPEMHETSKFIVGGALEGAKRIIDGEVQQAFSILGGLHHAFKESASGFCYYNDIVVTIRFLQQHYNLKRILYIDTDVHHGDGVLDAFYEENSVLCISIHESGQFLFPSTGYSNEIGENSGLGYTINMPLFPGTWDDHYIKLFEKVIPCIWKQYDPEFVIWQCGADGHSRDFLGHLNLTTKTYRYLASRIVDLTKESTAQGKLLLLGGGGYNPDSVARVWLTILAGITGIQLPDEAPSEWIEFCNNEYGFKTSRIINDPPIDLKTVDRPALIEEANHQYLNVLKEELKEIGVWVGCTGFS